jgi:hypothetical protein
LGIQLDKSQIRQKAGQLLDEEEECDGMSLDAFMKQKKKVSPPQKRKVTKVPGGRKRPRRVVAFWKGPATVATQMEAV